MTTTMKIPSPFRRMPTRALFVLLAATLLLAPATATAEEDRSTLNVMSDTDIVTLLETVRQTTGYSIVWNPHDKNIRGKKITGGTKFVGTPEEIFSQFRALLTFYELVTIPLGSKDSPTWAVMDARQTSSILRLKPTNVNLDESNLDAFANKDGLFITTTIQVEHMNDLRNARNALTRIVTGSNIGNVTEVPDAKAFVITDFAPNVVAIYRLLKRMDRPSRSSSTTAGTTVAIDLEHAQAREAATTLTGLFAASATLPQQRGRQPSTYGAPTAPRIVADGRTNRLLVTGSKEAIAKVREAVALVDVPVRVASTKAHYVMLEHIRAGEAATALTALVAASPTMWSTGASDPVPSIVDHSETNALLISATKAQAETLLALIAQMDKQR